MRLQVDPTVSNIAEYESAGEVIASAIADDAENARRLTIRNRLPAVITRATYSLDRATFEIADGVLNLLATPTGIDFDHHPSKAVAQPSDECEYELVWSSGESSQFCPHATVQKSVARTLARIHASNFVTLIFQNGGGVLDFRTLWCNTLNRHILYLYELEPLL